MLGVPVITSSVVTIPWDPLGVVGVWSPSFEFVDCESKFVKAVNITKFLKLGQLLGPPILASDSHCLE